MLWPLSLEKPKNWEEFSKTWKNFYQKTAKICDVKMLKTTPLPLEIMQKPIIINMRSLHETRGWKPQKMKKIVKNLEKFVKKLSKLARLRFEYQNM